MAKTWNNANLAHFFTKHTAIAIGTTNTNCHYITRKYKINIILNIGGGSNRNTEKERKQLRKYQWKRNSLSVHCECVVFAYLYVRKMHNFMDSHCSLGQIYETISTTEGSSCSLKPEKSQPNGNFVGFLL